jgi:GT2 family glycosyltransferase
MKRVAVVILNWNGQHYLDQFLPTVIKYSSEAEIFVADNCSSDNSVNYVREKFEGKVNLICLPANGGFSKGYNQALKQINAEYYVLLNSDVEVTKDWIEPVVSLMDDDPGIAACQPKIMSYRDRQFFEYAGAAGGFIDKYGYPFCRGRIFNNAEKDEGQYDDTKEIFWATGACLFIRAETYWQLGGLDEDFFAHMEEIDLCWRIKNAGYKIFYHWESKVFHVGAGTLPHEHSRKTFLNFRNGLYLLYKNLSPERVFPVIFRRMNLDGIAAIKFLLEGKVTHFVAVLKAHTSFYGNLIKFYHKRKRMKKNIVNYHHPQIYPLSIVGQYYLKGRKTFRELNWNK